VSGLVGYAQACDLNLTISSNGEQSVVERVKAHVFPIKDHLHHFAKLAQGDNDVFDSIPAFYAEYLMSVLQVTTQEMESSGGVSKREVSRHS